MKSCGVCCVKCTKCGVQGDKSTLITELILSFIITAVIDVAIEYGWQSTNSWLKKALLSSGLASLCMIVVSTVSRSLKYNCAESTEVERHQQTDPSIYYTATLISEILSGLVSFGAGVGIDALIELTFSHEQLKNWEKSDSFLYWAVIPISITATKSLSRFGIFRLTDFVINKCRTKDLNVELNEELTPLKRI